MARPLKNCPRCNNARVSAERRRSLGGVVQEVYVSCPVCKQDSRVRLTTDVVERERDALHRWQERARILAERGHVSSTAEEAARLQMVRLRNAAVRDGLLDQVPELCQPPSSNP